MINSKATEIGYALLFSPLVGFLCAAALLILMKFVIRKPELYAAPKGKFAPPWWICGLLIFTSACVSFAHGSNDGQKGMGLIMLILIGVVPTAYALNRTPSAGDVLTFLRNSEAASKVVDAKAAGYDVLGDPRPAVTNYVTSQQINEGTYPSLAALIRDIANQVELVPGSTCGSWTSQERKLQPGILVNWWLGARMSCAVIGIIRKKLHLRSETGCFVRETSAIRMQTGISTSWTA